jgi:hypothetical protein
MTLQSETDRLASLLATRRNDRNLAQSHDPRHTAYFALAAAILANDEPAPGKVVAFPRQTERLAA